MRSRRHTAVGLILTAIMALSLGTAAFAWEIDPAQMKALEAEAAEQYPLVIVEKKVVEECITTTDFRDPTDVLSFTIENRSEDEVQAFVLKFVSYDDENQTTAIVSSFVLSVNETREIQTLSKEGLELKPGESCVVSTAVNFDLFSGVRAIIEAYTLEDGTVVENPSYSGWENLAFGLSAGNVTELD